jgi:hypothetical protein
MTTRKKTAIAQQVDSSTSVTTSEVVDFALIAEAIAFKTHDAIRNSRSADSLYAEKASEVAIGDLVANISDLTVGASCLDSVGTVLEIRDGEIEVRRIDGVTRYVLPAIGTYVAAKGGKDVSV